MVYKEYFILIITCHSLIFFNKFVFCDEDLTEPESSKTGPEALKTAQEALLTGPETHMTGPEGLKPLPKFECENENPVQCPINLKTLSDKCLSNNECMNPGVCYNGVCQCPGQLVEYEGQCVKAPSLDENCLNEKCLTPFVCFRGKCDCPQNMKRNEGKCKLECKETEIETATECVTVAKLGAACTTNQQCNVAFSHCFEGKCHCSNGTKPAGEACQAALNCPDGQQPVKTAKGEVEKCTSLYCPSSRSANVVADSVKLDSCPLKSYCVIPSYQDSVGFCCPDKPYCPMGEPLLDKKCQNPDNDNERCPSNTHHCYAGLRGVHCCPLPCPSIPGKITIVHQDKCYTKKEVGENCQVTAQCRFDSECVNNTCECPDGFVTQFVDGEPRCRKVCQPDEILAGHVCLDIVAPNQECKVSAQCTGGTKCKDAKCQCPCNQPMYNGECLTDSLCPNFGYGSYTPQVNKKGQLIECVPNSQKYGSCTTGYFCNTATVYAGGVCCPLPEPMCDNRRRPSKDKDGKYNTCTERFPNCPRGEYCKDYVTEKLPTMAQMVAVDGVCCPRLFGDTDGQRFVTRQTSLYTNADCPTGHKLDFNQNGEVKTCNFQSYAGECGQPSACFKLFNRNNNGPLSPTKSGICCRWMG